LDGELVFDDFGKGLALADVDRHNIASESVLGGLFKSEPVVARELDGIRLELLHLASAIALRARLRGLPVPRHDVITERLDGGSWQGEEALEVRKAAEIHVCHLDLMTSKNAARGDRTALSEVWWGFRFCGSWRNSSGSGLPIPL
jgi:hypothetical protein